jgi:AraC-like DNA-binding protein
MSQNPSPFERTVERPGIEPIPQPLTSVISAAGVAALSVLQKQYQDLIRQHLDEVGRTFFAELTGLHFHVAWSSSHPSRDRSRMPTAYSVCCRLANSAPTTHCSACGPRHLKLALRPGRHGHRFRCAMGVNNYWFPITVRDLTVGIAFVQTLDKTSHIMRHHLRRLPVGDGARPWSSTVFNQAARLLRLIVKNAETATLAVLSQTDLERVRQAVDAVQHEKNRLQQQINHLLPASEQLPSLPHPLPPPTVQRMLDYLHQHYAEPITLRQCAQSLGRNAAYLSDLFAQKVGLSFKIYLTELRLEKSKELLADPNRNVSEVALATGYVSEDRFRIAFKKATGLPPRVWRETMRASQLTLLMWFLYEMEFLGDFQVLFLS